MKNKFKKSVFLLSSLMMLSVGAGIINVAENTVNVAEAADQTYSYTFTAKQFSANGTKTLGGVDWTLSGDGGYWGNDSTKGQQFGSGNKPYKSMTLTSSEFTNVSSITINTSGANSINASFIVSVGGTQVGSSTTLTNTATGYTFDCDQLDGAVSFAYTQTSSKAIYIKSIIINYATDEGSGFTVKLSAGDYGEFVSGLETETEYSEAGTYTLPAADKITNKFSTYVDGITVAGFKSSSGESYACESIVNVEAGTTFTAEFTYPTDTVVLDSVNEAIEVAKISGSVNTPFIVAVDGNVSDDPTYNSSNDNYTFTISDDTGSIKCYGVSGSDKITNGDTVTVTGNLINFNGSTPEFNYDSTFEFKDLGKLVTPSEVTLDKENSLIKWNSVEGASGYKLYVLDENANEVINETIYNGTSYDVSTLANGEYIGTIQAIGNNNYSNGDAVDFTFELSQDVGSQISAIETQSSLGFSYDVTEGNQQSSTITFDDTSKRTSYSTEQQIWEENGLTVTNNKASSTSNVGDYYKPARFYKSTTVKIESSNPFTKIVFTANSASYATALNSSITGGSVNDKVVTVEFAEAVTEYEFTATGGQIRMDSITVESGEEDTYTFDNIRIRFAANVTEGLYEELNLATAEVGFKVTDGTKTHNIDCTGKFESDGQGNYFIICSIWNIPTDVEFTATAFVVIGETTYYGQSTTYSVKTLAQTYIDNEETLLAGYSEEAISAVKAFNDYVNA